MMKRFLIFSFILAGTIVSTAQFEFKPGVRAGINYSKITNINADNKTDFFVGAQFGLKFVDFYTLQPELTYSRQGFKSDKTYSLDYLSLSITNKFTFGGGFNALVGPILDIKVGDNFSEFVSNEIVNLDFAFAAGLGYTFQNGFAVDMRFKQGLIDIFGDNINEESQENIDDVRLNQLFQFGVSYTFDVK